MKTITETVTPPPTVTHTVYVCEEPGCRYRTTFLERAEAHPGYHRATRRVLNGVTYLYFASAVDMRAYVAAWDFQSNGLPCYATEKHPYSSHMLFPGWFTGRENSDGVTRLISLDAHRSDLMEEIEEAKERLVALDVVRAALTEGEVTP